VKLYELIRNYVSNVIKVFYRIRAKNHLIVELL
jgi:hypothetical protein